jgi:hypothetical protein
MKRTYESARVLVRRATGPLASHLDPFIASLIGQQYRASVIYIRSARVGFRPLACEAPGGVSRSADRAVSGPPSTNTDYVPLGMAFSPLANNANPGRDIVRRGT